MLRLATRMEVAHINTDVCLSNISLKRGEKDE